jgi:hypothetical protein
MRAQLLLHDQHECSALCAVIALCHELVFMTIKVVDEGSVLWRTALGLDGALSDGRSLTRAWQLDQRLNPTKQACRLFEEGIS